MTTGTGRLLVAYATKHGSTKEVAEAIALARRECGDVVDVLPAADVRDLEGYDGVVLGGSLYMGRWHRDARAFLKRHRHALRSLPLAVFAIGPKTLAEADVAGARGQLDAALRKVPDVTPASVAIFGGVIDPSKLRFPFSRLPASDARDWNAIRSWAEQLTAVRAEQPATPPRTAVEST